MQRCNQKPRDNRKCQITTNIWIVKQDIGARTSSVYATINPLNEQRLICAKLRTNWANVFVFDQLNLNCGLRFGIVLVLGIGIAQQFLPSIVLGIVLVCRTWYSPSLVSSHALQSSTKPDISSAAQNIFPFENIHWTLSTKLNQ